MTVVSDVVDGVVTESDHADDSPACEMMMEGNGSGRDCHEMQESR